MAEVSAEPLVNDRLHDLPAGRPRHVATDAGELTIARPAPGETRIVYAEHADLLKFAFPLDQAKTGVKGIDIYFVFDDGAQIIIAGLGLELTSGEPVRLVFADQPIETADFFARMGPIETESDYKAHVVQSTTGTIVEDTGTLNVSMAPTRPIHQAEEVGETTHQLIIAPPVEVAKLPEIVPLPFSPSSFSDTAAQDIATGQTGQGGIGTVAAPLLAKIYDYAQSSHDGPQIVYGFGGPGGAPPQGNVLGDGAKVSDLYTTDVIAGSGSSDQIYVDDYPILAADGLQGYAVVIPRLELNINTTATLTGLLRFTMPSGYALVAADGVTRIGEHTYRMPVTISNGQLVFDIKLAYKVPAGDATPTAGDGFYDKSEINVAFEGTTENGEPILFPATLHVGVRDITSEKDLEYTSADGSIIYAIQSLPGANSVAAGEGNDVIHAGAAQDTIDGEGGIDTVSYVYSGVGVQVSLQDSGPAQVGTDGFERGDRLVNIENLTGSDFADKLAGNSADNSLSGGKGDDQLSGGAGADTLEGGTGANTLAGGADGDTYIVTSAGDVIVENQSDGGVDRVVVRGLSSFTLAPNAEALLYEGTGAFSGRGNVGDNLIQGSSGNDTLDGSGGADTLDGREGDNALYGGAGLDLLLGGSGNDTLDGGYGADLMKGGEGNDVYVIDHAGDVVVDASGANTGLIGKDGMAGGMFSDDGTPADVGYTLSGDLSLLHYLGTSSATLAAGTAGDTIIGGTGRNSLIGTGQDSLIGNAGEDSFSGSGGNSFAGGAGNDVYHISSRSERVVGEGDETSFDTIVVDGSITTFSVADAGLGLEALVYDGGQTFSGFGDIHDNLLVGGTASNTLAGNSGSDTLVGGRADDSLSGGDGADSMAGGAGNDTYAVDNLGDQILEDGGTGGGVDTINIVAAADGSYISGYTLAGVAENVEVLSFTGGTDFTGQGSNGAETLMGGSGHNLLRGMAGNDSLLGRATDDTLDGGADADTLAGGGGANSLAGGTGNDVLMATGTADTLLGGEDKDTLLGGTGVNVLDGGAGADSLAGGSGPETLLGGAGADTLVGGTGADSVDGGEDADLLVGSNGRETLQGGSGADTLDGRLGGASLDGGDDADLILGSTSAGGHQTILGGDGADTIVIGAGTDFVDGGGGDDVYVIDATSNPGVVISDAEGTDTIRTSLGVYNLSAAPTVENLTFVNSAVATHSGTGNALANVITGNAGSDTLVAAANADPSAGDTLLGLGGNNRLVAAAGHGDSLVGGDDNNTLVGNSGADSLVAGTGANSLSGQAGNDYLEVGASGATGGGSILDGGGDNDTLVALSGANSLSGGTGNDSLQAADGADTLLGGAGNDTLDGGDGNNLLSGDSTSGSGNDVLRVGDGASTLYGSAGNDTLVATTTLATSNSSLYGNAGHDVLTVTGIGRARLDGGSGDDVLQGGDGADTLYGGTGTGGETSADTLSGGLGGDSMVGGSSGSFLDGEEGSDTLLGSAAADTLLGGDGNDRITASAIAAGGSSLYGGAGNDTLFGSSAANTLSGGTDASNDSDLIQGGSGNEMILAGPHDTARGGGGADTIVLSSTNDVIDGDAGGSAAVDLILIHDPLDGATRTYALTSATNVEQLTYDGTGAFTLGGDSASNTITLGADGGSIAGGAGDDSLVGGSAGANTLDGGSNDDTLLGGLSTVNSLSGGADNDSLRGGDLADTLAGGSGLNTLSGGAGSDVYIVSQQSDVLVEAAGGGTADEVRTTLNTFALSNGDPEGHSDIEILTHTGAGGFTATGDADDQTIHGTSSNDSVDGQGGIDVFTVAESLDVAKLPPLMPTTAPEWAGNKPVYLVSGDVSYDGLPFLAFANKAVTVYSATQGTDIVRNIEYVEFDNVVFAIQQGVQQYGDQGYDAAGNPLPFNANHYGSASAAGPGSGNALNANDEFTGTLLADDFFGGYGDNVYHLDQVGDRAVVDAARVNGSQTILLGTDWTPQGVFSLQGNVAAFSSSGGSLIDNVLYQGGAAAPGISILGNDRANSLVGGGASDTLDGGAGNDTLDGNGGANSLSGGAGADSLIARGQDTLDGGTENDLLVIATGATGNSVMGGSNDDTLSGTGANTLAGGTGNDTYLVTDTVITIAENAGEGTDTVVTTLTTYALPGQVENLASSYTNSLPPGGGVDFLGNALANSVAGSMGSDTLEGGANTSGADTLAGGAGDDRYILDNAGDRIVELPNGGTDTADLRFTIAAPAGMTLNSAANTVAGAALDLTNVENLVYGGTVDLSVTGSAAANVITTGAGNDSLSAGMANLDGTAGDTLTGGGGNDTYFVSNTNDLVVENAGGGTDLVQSGIAAYTLAGNVENLLGVLNTGQMLAGNADANSIAGGTGADTLDGGANGQGAGGDTLNGGAGNDYYVLRSAADTITGENATSGIDTVELRYNPGVTLTLGQNNAWAGGSLDLTNIENLVYAGPGALTVTGSAVANVIDVRPALQASGANPVGFSLLGGGGNDTIYGGAGADTIDAGTMMADLAGGNFVLTTTSDSLVGGAGNDIYLVKASQAISISEDPDTALGGTDTIYYFRGAAYTMAGGVENLWVVSGFNASGQPILSSQFQVIYANGADNLVYGPGTGLTASGYGGNDTLVGGATNWLNGGAGADSLLGGYGADTIDGGSENDTILAFDGANSVLGGTGADSILAGINNDTIDAGDDNDTIDAGNGFNSVTGGLGSDSIVAGGFDDTIDGGADNDTILAGNGYNRIFGGAGADSILAGVNNDSIDGGSEADTINAGDGANTVYGGAGADSILTGTGNDWIDGGSEADIINAGNGANTVYGGAGADSILGGSGSDTIDAGQDNDTVDAGNSANSVFGGAGDDSLVSGNQADTLDGGTGNDTMAGGTFNDIYFVDSLGDVVTEAAQAGADEVRLLGLTAAYSLAGNVENLSFWGSDGQATTLAGNLFGNTGNNLITGSDGNDTLNGGWGADTLVGGNGDDLLQVATGSTDKAGLMPVGNAPILSGLATTMGLASSSFTVSLLDTSISGRSGWAFTNAAYGGAAAQLRYDPNQMFLTIYGSKTFTWTSPLTWKSTGGNLVTIVYDGTTASAYVNGQDVGAATVTVDTAAAGTSTGSFARFDGAGTTFDNLRIYDRALTASEVATIAAQPADPTAVSSGLKGLYTFDGATPGANLAGSGAGFGGTMANVTATTGGYGSLAGGAGNDSLAGLDFADTLDGGTGADTMAGGAGNDIYYVDSTSDKIVEAAGGGMDSILLSVGTATSLPATGNVYSYSLAALPNVEGLGVDTRAGTAPAANAAFSLVGNNAGDSISGWKNNDTLVGGNGNNTFYGGGGADSIVSGTGNDTYMIDTASGSYDATTKMLTLTSSFSSSGGSDTFVLNPGLNNPMLFDLNSFSHAGINNVFGGYAGIITAVTVIGDGANNSISGYGGNDSLVGGGGADTFGNSGGADTMDGGAGNDVYSLFAPGQILKDSGGIDTVSLGSVNSLSTFDAMQNLDYSAANTDSGIETITINYGTPAFGSHSWNVFGDDFANNIQAVNRGIDYAVSIDGRDGNDTIGGGAWNDTLLGGAGNDSINGGPTSTSTGTIVGNGNDFIDGGMGADTIDGGGGIDTVLGGLGDDVFRIDATNLNLSARFDGGAATGETNSVQFTGVNAASGKVTWTGAQLDQILDHVQVLDFKQPNVQGGASGAPITFTAADVQGIAGTISGAVAQLDIYTDANTSGSKIQDYVSAAASSGVNVSSQTSGNDTTYTFTDVNNATVAKLVLHAS